MVAVWSLISSVSPLSSGEIVCSFGSSFRISGLGSDYFSSNREFRSSDGFPTIARVEHLRLYYRLADQA